MSSSEMPKAKGKITKMRITIRVMMIPVTDSPTAALPSRFACSGSETAMLLATTAVYTHTHAVSVSSVQLCCNHACLEVV